MAEISYNDFLRVELRVGTILEVEEFPEAHKPAYKLKIDLGELGVKRSSAQIKNVYSKEELIGKQVVCVTNFPPKQIGPFLSEVLTTGFDGGKGVILTAVDQEVQNGKRLY
ncbi:MAG TPA: tRNA-binding protein [Candidatus Nanoarchaeia archaeon]|nr:tRNA-binding protein [Candidatus Nanoarchaeia archaeon]